MDKSGPGGNTESIGVTSGPNQNSAMTTEPPDLTETPEVDKHHSTTELDSMSDGPTIDDVIALMRKAFAKEGERAVQSFIASLHSQHVNSDVPARKNFQPETRPRAPAGSARALCKRALAQAKTNGMTPAKIYDNRSGEYEMMLSLSAVRNELQVGEKSNPAIYRHSGGVWYLSEYAPATMRIVS
jgi:hypothetical protein